MDEMGVDLTAIVTVIFFAFDFKSELESAEI